MGPTDRAKDPLVPRKRKIAPRVNRRLYAPVFHHFQLPKGLAKHILLKLILRHWIIDSSAVGSGSFFVPHKVLINGSTEGLKRAEWCRIVGSSEALSYGHCTIPSSENSMSAERWTTRRVKVWSQEAICVWVVGLRPSSWSGLTIFAFCDISCQPFLSDSSVASTCGLIGDDRHVEMFRPPNQNNQSGM